MLRPFDFWEGMISFEVLTYAPYLDLNSAMQFKQRRAELVACHWRVKQAAKDW